jgi:hypothetical protein
MSKTKITLLILAVVVVTGRIAISFVIRGMVNQQLAAIPDYHGSVGSASLGFLRGVVTLNKLQILDNAGQQSITVNRVSAGIAWLTLLHGRLVAKIGIHSPRVRLVVSKASKVPEKTWGKAGNAKAGAPSSSSRFLPSWVDRIELTDGIIRLEMEGANIQAEAQKDLKRPAKKTQETQPEPGLGGRFTDLHILVENLTNSRKLGDPLFVTGVIDAKVPEKGTFHLDLKANPATKWPEFTTAFSLKNIDLPSLNQLLRWEWNIDVKKGMFDMSSEVAARGGHFKGYVKPVISNLQMTDLRQERNAGKAAEEAAVGSVFQLFKNRPKDRMTEKIPFEGSFSNQHIGLGEAVFSILKNAFVKAFVPNFDLKANIKDVYQKWQLR